MTNTSHQATSHSQQQRVDQVSEPASWTSASIAELDVAYDDGETTPEHVLDEVFSRITRDTALNAYHVVTHHEALAAAQSATARRRAGRSLGPLDGVPVTVKENLGRRGVTMPSGAAALSNPPVPTQDSPVVTRLREAGAIIVGSTVMPDWGMLSSGVSSLHGVTRSSWNPALTTGGSSSGAAVTAASAHGPVHFGSDIGGSIRLPGTWNGLATLKPSAGLIPLDSPYVGRAAGPMARRTADLFAAMAITARWDDRDASTHPYPPIDFSQRTLSPKGLRVGVHLDGAIGHPLDPEVRAVCLATADQFADAGAQISEISPITTNELLTRIDRFWRARSLNTLRGLPDGTQDGAVLDYIERWCRGAEGLDGATIVGDFEACGGLGARTRELTRDFDIVLSPVTPELAFPASDPMPRANPDLPMGHISYTLPFNMSGQPAGTVNAGRAADGRWIGLQIAGSMGADADILAVMAWWEKVRPVEANPPWSQLDG
ncbi:MAG: amidase [Micrococcaceae bacterium]|nr:amidase [Micrococcaceae bacterium]